MAEIGLVASIFSVAAVGTSVATTLYEAADVMIHADRQIYTLAKHVSQFAAVLKHMGEVLDKEKSNCSKEVLRDIKKIKHSCKRTFKEINSTMKPKRIRHFVSLQWLFKRTKAMELEARLNSQQSMVQCVIHTLTVSKLGQMDSRSQEDSGHLTDLKMEIKLLKTFIMENYNNLAELRQAEHLAEAEAGGAPPPGGYPEGYYPDGNGGAFPSNPPDEFKAHEPRSMRPPSLTSNDSSSGKDESKSDDDSDADADITNFKDTIDQTRAGPAGGTSNAEASRSRFALSTGSSRYSTLNSSTRPESSLFLQMVPYTPRPPLILNSDRLILGSRSPDRGAKTATGAATDSVRLLLDKWTTSGSAPVSSLLDVEADRDAKEAGLAEESRMTGSPSNHFRRGLSPVAEYNENLYRHPDYSEFDGYPRPRDHHAPPPPPWSKMPPFSPYYPIPPALENQQPHNGYPHLGIYNPRHKDFWRRSRPIYAPTDTALGSDILAALRSTRGGIYYTKSSLFEQVHYVDQYPIYTCALVPSVLVPPDQKKVTTTEVFNGLIRGEALDLLGYTYEDTKTGIFAVSGDLELSEIEELVKLSYRALDKYSTRRSKALIKEKGWDEIVTSMNITPGTHPNGPSAVPGYSPPMPESRYPYDPSINAYPRPQWYGEHEDLTGVPDRSAPYPPHQPPVHPRRNSFVRPRGYNIQITPPNEVAPQEEAAKKPQRPEVRFTLPRAQLTSGNVDKDAKAQASPTQPEVPTTSTGDELHAARQKLEQYKKKQEAAEKANDISAAADIKYYAIPDLEARIQKLQEKHAAPASENKDDKKIHQTEVETESEGSDDDGSDVQSLYD